MRVRFLSAFDHQFQRLRPLDRKNVIQAIDAVIDYIEQSKPPPKGLGLKKLGGTMWEVRIGLKTRIVFSLSQDLLRFLLVGSHNDVRRFLKRGGASHG